MRQINCVISDEIYDKISDFCHVHRCSRAEVAATLLTQLADRLDMWLPTIKEYQARRPRKAKLLSEIAQLRAQLARYERDEKA